MTDASSATGTAIPPGRNDVRALDDNDDGERRLPAEDSDINVNDEGGGVGVGESNDEDDDEDDDDGDDDDDDDDEYSSLLDVVLPIGGCGGDDANENVASSSTMKDAGVEPSSSPRRGGWEDAASSPPSPAVVVVAHRPLDEDAVARCLALSVDSHLYGDGSAMMAFEPIMTKTTSSTAETGTPSSTKRRKLDDDPLP
jgi:hypothetical protein